MSAELRLGRWQEALSDVAEVDAVVTDPPYSDRTHSKQRHGRRDETCGGHYVSARGLTYDAMSEHDVADFVASWAPRNRGWFAVLTDSYLQLAWRQSFADHGLTHFAPIPCVQIGMNVRLAGDGPCNWTCWLCVARPKALHKWGTLGGEYRGNPFDAGENTATAGRRTGVVGSKPVWMMRAIVRDYTKPGNLVCDPFAGGGTTLVAALQEGRRAIGSECLDEHYRIAQARLARGYTAPMFVESAAEPEQLKLGEP